MKQIPNTQTHILTQQNTGDVLGDLFASKGIDLTDNLGKLRGGKRMLVNMRESDSPPYLTGAPVGFREFNIGSGFSTYRIYSVSGAILVSGTDYPAGQFVIDGSVGYPGQLPLPNTSDIEIYNGNLYVTAVNDLLTLASTGIWSTASFNTLTSTSSHQMCSYNGLLYIVDKIFQIYSWNGSSLNTSLLSLSNANVPQSVITFIKAAADCIWIGTLNQNGDKAYVYKWDGVSASTTSEYKLDSAGALACVIKDDVPWIIDVYGRLMTWNGGTFIEKGRINRRRNRLLYNALALRNDRFVHTNGMTIVDGRINVLLNTQYYDSTGSIDESDPSGIWEYDDAIGFYHKHSLGLSKAGEAVSDYGAFRIAGAGGMYETNFPDTSSSRNGTFMAGASYYLDATTVGNGVFYDDSNDTVQKGSYIVTQKIEATDGSVYNFPTVEAMWQSFYTLYRKLLNSTDKIIPKYRYNDIPSVEGAITWTSSTTFDVPNTTVNITPYLPSPSQTGGEVEIMQGNNAGWCMHIKSATLNGSGIWTVTVDETMVTTSGTSMARFQNWIKISEITPNNQNFNSDTISQKSTWIQFKVFYLFTGRNEIERFLISNANETPVK
jgi:hypothetical protein